MGDLEELVVRAQLGDGAAYEAIYARFKEMAMSYAFSVLGDRDLAEDARQEAFLTAYCDLLTLRDPKAFPAWFKKVLARHTLRVRTRYQVLSVPLEAIAEPTSPGATPRGEAENKERERHIHQSIQSLPDEERKVAALYFLEERSVKQISRETGLAQRTISRRLHSAKARLRHRLMKHVSSTVHRHHLAGDSDFKGLATHEAITAFTEELDSLAACRGEKGRQRAGNLICARGRLQRFIGLVDQAMISFEQALEDPDLKSDPYMRARFRGEMGLTLLSTSKFEDARAHLEKSRNAVRRLPDEFPLLPGLLNGLGICAWAKGNYRKSRNLYSQALESCQEKRTDSIREQVLNNLALLEWKAGNLDTALTHFRECLKISRRLRQHHESGVILMNIGIVEENLGRFTQARTHYKQALAMAEKAQFPQLAAATLTNLANLALTHRKWNLALEHSSQALETTRRIGDRRSEAIALENLALAHIGFEQFSNARERIATARNIAQEIGDRERLVSLDLVDLEASIVSGNIPPSPEVFERLEQEIRRQDYVMELPRLLRLRAEYHTARGEYREARRYCNRAIKTCGSQKNVPEEKQLKRTQKDLRKRESS